MKTGFYWCLLAAALPLGAQSGAGQRFEALMKDILIVDTHVDTPAIVADENYDVGVEHRYYDADVVFPCSKGNWVFNAGTICWGEGLSQPPAHIPARHNTTGAMGPDERVQQITRNVLDRMIKESHRGGQGD